MDVSNVIYESQWGADDTGRVFYKDDRVFRAINPCAKRRVLDFLESDLYHYLVDNEYIIKTWIAHDIIIPGYPLVLEHEYVFCSRPEDWTFEMRKKVAVFTLKILDISRQYGYCIIDPGQHNIAISCGKIIYVDFGSFRISNNSKVDTYFANRFIALYHYLPLAIMQESGSFVYISFSNKLPREGLDCSKLIVHYIKKVIKKYEIYYHSNSWHLSFHASFIFNNIPVINNAVRRLIPKAGAKNLIKRRVVYQTREVDFSRLKNPNTEMNLNNILPMEDSSISKCIYSYAKSKSIFFNTILCVGNFLYEDILLLTKITKKFVNVLSFDSVYIDSLFKTIGSHSPINPICGHIVYFHRNNNVKQRVYGCELLIIKKQFETLATTQHYPPPHDFSQYDSKVIAESIASYCQKYLLIPSSYKTDYIDAIENFFSLFDIVEYNNESYRLYRKKCMHAN